MPQQVQPAPGTEGGEGRGGGGWIELYFVTLEPSKALPGSMHEGAC